MRLMVNKLRYHRDGYKEEYLRGGSCVVAYNPDDVSHIWLELGKREKNTKLLKRSYGVPAVLR